MGSPPEYSTAAQQHQGHITKTGNRHARRLLTEAAWHYRHPPRLPKTGPEPDQRAWQAQPRPYHHHRHLTGQGKPSTIVNIAVARELPAFLWAAITDQPHRQEAAA